MAIAAVSATWTLGGAVESAAAESAAAGFVDPLDSAANFLPAPEQGAFLGLGSTGQRLVGVGLRGLAVVSEDGGGHWRQAAVPVQSDLTAVRFVTAEVGWAAGHDGVILTTADAGAHWSKVLDGRMSQRAFEEYYAEKIAHGQEELQPYLEQIQMNFQAGPSLPYLDICFDTPSFGLAVGPFGMIAATEDGGKTWKPWLEHVDNPDFLGFNAIRRIGGEIYMAGERGTVFRFDRAAQKFSAFPTGYRGGLFGIVGNDRGDLVAFGLQGTLVRGEDGGRRWTRLASPVTTTITGGTLLPDGGPDGALGGAFMLVTIAGQVLVSRDGGLSFRLSSGGGVPGASDATVAGAAHVVIASLAGLAVKPVADLLRAGTALGKDAGNDH